MSRSPARLRLGTRGSKLALAQAHTVKRRIEGHDPGIEVEIVPITTSGDRGQREVLGSFVREIQQMLLEDRIDVALHCLKDLPTEPVAGLRLSAHLEREDARDVLIGRVPSIANLPEGALIGTGSARRSAQIAARRRDLRFSPLVGNIDTRLRKAEEGHFEAIILARAGLLRLGLLEDWRSDLTVTPMEFDEMLPAPGQAVLVVETRLGDAATDELVRALNHEPTRRCAEAERYFLGAFGGGCSLPVAAYCTFDRGALHLVGLVASPDGSTVLRGSVTAEAPEEAARHLFDVLEPQGALTLLGHPSVVAPGSAR